MLAWLNCHSDGTDCSWRHDDCFTNGHTWNLLAFAHQRRTVHAGGSRAGQCRRDLRPAFACCPHQSFLDQRFCRRNARGFARHVRNTPCLQAFGDRRERARRLNPARLRSDCRSTCRSRPRSRWQPSSDTSWPIFSSQRTLLKDLARPAFSSACRGRLAAQPATHHQAAPSFRELAAFLQRTAVPSILLASCACICLQLR